MQARRAVGGFGAPSVANLDSGACTLPKFEERGVRRDDGIDHATLALSSI